MTRLLAPFVLVVSLAAAPDVVSVVKPNRSGGEGGQLGVPLGGRFSATNVSVAALISAAYGAGLPLPEERIFGLPAWAARERFDVDARQDDADALAEPDDDEAFAQAFWMLRIMLADRFALRVHDESRQAAVYVLRRLASARGGMRATQIDCDAIRRAGPFAAVLDFDGHPSAPCAVRMRAGAITGTGATMTQLAGYLSRVRGVEHEVFDRTGLEGRFDFNLAWAPPQQPGMGADGAAGAASSGPSIFTALHEQLGLTLEPARGPVRVLVVDRIARPTPN
jgi:uncharacterized protein (TIGR03435 family)